jgi:hypothetical protein
MFNALLNNVDMLKRIGSAVTNPKVLKTHFGDRGRRAALAIEKKPKKKPVMSAVSSSPSSRGFSRRSLADRSNVGLRI